MTAFIIRRVMQAVVVLLVMSLLVFGGVYLLGNPVDVLIAADADQLERQRAITALGLDRPLWEQYLVFVRDVLHGDLGKSFVYNIPALQLILQRMPATLELALTSMTIAVGLGIPLGLYAGYRPQSFLARTIMAGSILGFSLPTFWVGLMLIMVFAVELGWLPSTGRGATATVFGITSSLFTRDGLAHVLLPALNLALFNLALVIRLTRAGMQENMPMDYVKFARAKGLTMRRVILVHVFKNILIPLVTVIGLQLGAVFAFAVVTESIFAWPGMGKLIIDSINRLDRPVVVAYLLVTVTMFVLINLIVDILYSVLDPRVRLSDRS